MIRAPRLLVPWESRWQSFQAALKPALGLAGAGFVLERLLAGRRDQAARMALPLLLGFACLAAFNWRLARTPLIHHPLGPRLISLIPGLLLIPLLYRLGRAAGNSTAGMAFAVLGAFANQVVLQSQTVRQYSLLLCFLALIRCVYGFFAGEVAGFSADGFVPVAAPVSFGLFLLS